MVGTTDLVQRTGSDVWRLLHRVGTVDGGCPVSSSFGCDRSLGADFPGNRFSQAGQHFSGMVFALDHEYKWQDRWSAFAMGLLDCQATRSLSQSSFCRGRSFGGRSDDRISYHDPASGGRCLLGRHVSHRRAVCSDEPPRPDHYGILRWESAGRLDAFSQTSSTGTCGGNRPTFSGHRTLGSRSQPSCAVKHRRSSDAGSECPRFARFASTVV